MNEKSMAQILLTKQYWWIHCSIVTLICVVGLLYLGQQTYSGSPPRVDYNLSNGQTIIEHETIKRGEELFHLRGLMNYGSFWGDGAERGPDFSADALHRTIVGMKAFYENELRARGATVTQYDLDAIATRVKREVRFNTWNEEAEHVILTDAHAYAFDELKQHYTRMFSDPEYLEYYQKGIITEEADIEAVTAFFFWGGWVASTNRPGEVYSYTHNWPFDTDAGNVPTTATYLWSILAILGLFLGIGLTLYVYGQMKIMHTDPFTSGGRSLTTPDLENGVVRPTQKATYKFFALAVLLFVAQVLAGILSATDFVRPFGIYIGDIIPFSVLRSYHTLFQIMWFFMCWVGYTIFFLPRLSKVPRGQKFLVNLLFNLCLVVGIGSLVGIFLGQTGAINDSLSYWFGSQGWEFLELGRFFQYILLIGFALWIFIIYRGVKPWLTRKNIWSVPSWLLYGSGIMVMFLFFGLMVSPETNFAIADYWRWMVVHMWVEVTFEVFTSVIVAYMLVQMGLITRIMAERVIFIAVMLFLVTATLGISHNFYWIAKPTGIIAVGSVFSTLQVLPLLLLTLDAWRMRQEGTRAEDYQAAKKQTIVMESVWMFILAVNFWNVFGAGVFGSLINLPIVNYFEHATYLTGNHAHAAMFGVKGNVAIAGMLFCCQHLFPKAAWNQSLLRLSFWSLNIGIALMMFLDLFPVGIYQTVTVLTDGLWYARSAEIVQGSVFKTLTYFRSLGGAVFLFGGVLPLAWFVLSRGTNMVKDVKETEQDNWSIYEKNWAAGKDPI